MLWPEFSLRNVAKVLASAHDHKESDLGFSGSGGRADASQSASVRRSRITDWARASGRSLGKEELSQAFDGFQVGSELDAIFRETPSFGRSLARRLQDYHQRETVGSYQLIGGGGEAVVFFDEQTQDVIKLLSNAGKARFGWEVAADLEGLREIVPGSLATGLIRYARAEEMFPSGLEIEAVADDGSFLLMRQPFFLGENPYIKDMESWMLGLGWKKYKPETENRMLSKLTWEKDGIIATDVRPENVICSGSDLYSIDFIMATV